MATTATRFTRKSREIAALREVVLSSAYTLGDEQAALVLDALEFASEGRRYRADEFCEDCTRAPGGRCEPHAADVERAGQYDDLADDIRQSLAAGRAA